MEQPNKSTDFSSKKKMIGRYATAEEAALAKNADLITKLKKMNLQIIDGRPVVPKKV